jgi:hypothetical protein
MASHASSVFTMSLGTGSEQLPSSPRLAPAEPPATTQRDHLRPLEVAQCSLCGIARPLGLLVPDGGQACADIRWYCKDSISCTERWVAARRQPSAYVPATASPALVAAPKPTPDEAAKPTQDEAAAVQRSVFEPIKAKAKAAI